MSDNHKEQWGRRREGGKIGVRERGGGGKYRGEREREGEGGKIGVRERGMGRVER